MCVSEAMSAMLHSEPPLRLRLASPICMLRSVLCSSDALQHLVVSCWAQKLAGDMDMSLIDLFVVEFMRRHPPPFVHVAGADGDALIVSSSPNEQRVDVH